MTTNAQLLLNGVAAPQYETIDTLVLITNNNAGGELTYLYAIVDQPPGPADNLTSTNLPSTSLTCRKEGSYLLRLTVNAGLIDEKTTQGEILIRNLISQTNEPAAGETIETDATRGWATKVGGIHAEVASLVKDSGRLAGIAAQAGLLVGTVVRLSSTTTIKTGLPGQEPVPAILQALATTQAHMRQALFLVVSGVINANPGNGELLIARRDGMVYGLAGAPGVGDPLYVSDTGSLSTTPGTYLRAVGWVVRAGGGTYDAYFDGGPAQTAFNSIWSHASMLPITAAATAWVLLPGTYATTPPLLGAQPIVRQPKGGRLSRLTGSANVVVVGKQATITVYKNGVATALTVTVTNGNYTTGVQDLDETHAVEFSNLDQIDVVVVNPNLAAVTDIVGLTATLVYSSN